MNRQKGTIKRRKKKKLEKTVNNFFAKQESKTLKTNNWQKRSNLPQIIKKYSNQDSSKDNI